MKTIKGTSALSSQSHSIQVTWHMTLCRPHLRFHGFDKHRNTVEHDCPTICTQYSPPLVVHIHGWLYVSTLKRRRKTNLCPVQKNSCTATKFQSTVAAKCDSECTSPLTSSFLSEATLSISGHFGPKDPRPCKSSKHHTAPQQSQKL